MKIKIALVALGLFTVVVSSCGNDKSDNDKKNKESKTVEVPDVVKSAFSAKYSTATDIKWDDAHEDNKQTFKAKFTIDGKKMKAEFDSAGTLVKEKEDD